MTFRIHRPFVLVALVVSLLLGCCLPVFAADAIDSDALPIVESLEAPGAGLSDTLSDALERSEPTATETASSWPPATPEFLGGSPGPASCQDCYSRKHCRDSCGGFCGRDVGLHCGVDPNAVFCFCGF